MNNVLRCPRCPAVLVKGFGCLAHGEPSEAPTAQPIVAAEPHKHWTAEEEAFAVAHMRQMTAREIASALTERFGHPRSLKSVKHWFARRGLSKPVVRSKNRERRQRDVWSRPVGPGKRWTDEELQALEVSEFKILLHRSPAAMYWQAWKMGTTLRSGDGYLSLTQVANTYGVNPAIVHRAIKRGILPAHRNGHLWRIDPADAERMYGRRTTHWIGRKR